MAAAHSVAASYFLCNGVRCIRSQVHSGSGAARGASGPEGAALQVRYFRGYVRCGSVRPRRSGPAGQVHSGSGAARGASGPEGAALQVRYFRGQVRGGERPAPKEQLANENSLCEW